MSQEEIVDNIILDFLEEKHPTSKSLILACPDKAKKRTAMLSVLDRENQDIFEDYKDIINPNNNSKCHEYIVEVTQLLHKYIKVADTDIKNYGEVLTPAALVNDMMDCLPSEVWSNKDLKWFDPCNGVGTFPAVIVTRLMEGLKDVILDDCERYEHIVNNMIYVCEIQPKNMLLFYCAFDRKYEYKLNTYFGSFLTNEFNEHMTNVWGVEKFDIIIGNPPYQTQKEGNTKTQAIWHYFVEKSFNILSENGYLNMVHPNGWRNIDGIFKGIQNIFKKNNLLYLEMHNEKDGINVFSASINYDWYVVQKSSYCGTTIIKTQNGEIIKRDISNMNFIPNGMFDEIFSLVSKEGEEKVNILHSYSSYETRKKFMSNIKNDEFKYPCIKNVTKSEEISVMYSNTNQNGHFNIPKLLCGSASSGSNFYIDIDGDFGITQFSFAIIDEPTNLELIKKCLNSSKFQKIIQSIPNFSQAINHKILSIFRKDFWKEFI